MCDFEDGFDNDDFMDEDKEMDDPLDSDIELDNEPGEGDDLTVDPFMLGGAMGFAYEQGLKERKKKRRKRFSDDSE